jgi:primase-polymerase (primpol)-like protein
MILQTAPAIAEIIQLDQWVIWKYVEGHDKDGNLKQDKPLFNLHTGYQGSHSNPAHWSSYDHAIAAATVHAAAGLGFVFSENWMDVAIQKRARSRRGHSALSVCAIATPRSAQAEPASRSGCVAHCRQPSSNHSARTSALKSTPNSATSR